MGNRAGLRLDDGRAASVVLPLLKRHSIQTPEPCTTSSNTRTRATGRFSITMGNCSPSSCTKKAPRPLSRLWSKSSSTPSPTHNRHAHDQNHPVRAHPHPAGLRLRQSRRVHSEQAEERISSSFLLRRRGGRSLVSTSAPLIP